MGLKIVSLKVANAIREAGYPQDRSSNCYNACTGEFHYTSCSDSWLKDGDYIDAPTYLEVWLWLWREKKICINCKLDKYNLLPMWWCTNEDDINYNTPNFNDPEEAIISIIEYLVDNKLLK